MDVFEAWLQTAGGAVRREVELVDLLAQHPDGRVLYVETKGETSSPGLDVDTLYGPLLRRMTSQQDSVRYAVVVPRSLEKAATPVPEHVRALLGVDVHLIDTDGSVVLLEQTPHESGKRSGQR